jgi:oxaloacetate decarboxylase gamma subunit
MTIVEMLEQSGILTLLGMAVVFAFLWIMIVCVNLVGKLIHRLGWDQDILQTEKATPKSKNKAVTPEITAAISAAVTEYQAKQ